MNEDIRGLLERAQPDVVGPLNLSEARKRAARRTAMRRGIRFGLAAIAVTAAGGAGLVLLERSPGDQLVGTVATQPSEGRIAPEENFAKNMQPCLAEFGWTVEITENNGIGTSSPTEVGPEYRADFATCASRFGYDRIPPEVTSEPERSDARVGPLRLGYLPSGFLVSSSGPDSFRPPGNGSGDADILEAIGPYDPVGAARGVPTASLVVNVEANAVPSSEALLDALEGRSRARIVDIQGRRGVVFSADQRTRSLVFHLDGFLIQVSGTSVPDAELERVGAGAVLTE